MPGRDISVVVPTFNERDNLGFVAERVARSLDGLDWEILFVDDNSPDGTAEAARLLSRDDARLRTILRIADRGLARATIQGILSGNGDILCVMDGDGQHDPDVIRSMIAPIADGEADVVSAARRLDDDLEPLGRRRLTLSRVGNAAARLVLGRPVRDPLTGFFAIRRDAFLSVAPKLRDPGFKLLLDILSHGRDLRHREVPFEFGSRRAGESKLDALVAWQFATYLASRLTGGVLSSRLISFLAVGGSGVVVHMSVLYALLLAGASFSAGQLGGALAAVSSNFLLNNLLTFRDKRLPPGLPLLKGYLKFVLISAVGIAANVSLATYAFASFTSVPLVAALAGIAIDTVWKFAVSGRVVWR